MPTRKQRTTVIALGAAFVLLSSTIVSSLNGIVPFFFNATANAATNNRIINSATVAGGSTTTAAPGADISGSVNVTTSETGGDVSSDYFYGTGWVIAATPPATNAFNCFDTGNHTSSNSFTEPLTLTAPTTPGTYNAYFVAYKNNTCTAGASEVFTLPNAVVVAAGDTSAPTVPNGLNATSVDQASFTLNWTASTDNTAVTQYEIFKDGASIGTTSNTTLDISGLVASTDYSMSVKARDAANNSSAASTPLVVTTSAATPPVTSYVENTNSHQHYTTIQAAIDASSSNDSITVAGAYQSSENVTVNKSLTIKAGSGATVASFKVTASDVTIDGFTVDGPVNGQAFTLLGGNTGETISNNTINVASGGYGATFNTGDTTFSDNTIIYAAGATSGLEANSNPGDNLKFENNTFSGAGSTASADISVIGTAGTQTANITLSGNSSTSGTSLLALFNSKGATISGNTTSNVGGSALYIGGNDSNVTITGNTISGSTTAINVANNFSDGANSNVVAHNNQLTGDTTGAKVGSGAYAGSVYFSQNWWGDASGPTISSNPSGTGSPVTSQVVYSPWCTNADCTTFSSSTAPPAPSTVVVKSGDPSWTTSDTRTNGHVDFVTDSDAPGGIGALSLKTDANPASGQDKAQYYNYKYYTSPLALSDVTGQLSYYTKQNSAGFSAGDPAYQIPVYLQDSAGNSVFTTLTYEPYIDKGNAAIQNGVWQKWTINRSTSKFYVSKDVSNANGSVVASQGSSTYSLDQINAIFPGAQVLGFGANIGSNNPGYDTEVDNFTFNNTTYDFEPNAPVNTSGPTLSNTTPADGSTVGGSFTVSTEATDPDGVASVKLQFQGSSNSQVYNLTHGSGNTWSAQINSKDFETGTGNYTLKFTAVDGLGKSRSNKATHYTIDNSAPSVTITSPTAGQNIKGRTISIKGSATDPNFNYYYCYVTLTGHGEVGSRDALCQTAWAAGTPGKTAFAQTATGTTDGTLGTVSLPSDLADGNYSVHVVTKDKFGNTTEATQDFVLDNTRPTVTFVTPTDFSQPFSSLPQIKTEVSDVSGISGTSVIHVYNSDGSPAKFCNGTVCDTSGLADGDYYVKAGATDSAGNNQTVTKYFTIDSTKPNVSITSPTDGQVVDPSFTASGTASDSATTISKVDYTVTKITAIGGTYVSNVSSGTASGTTSWSFDVSGLGDGFYRVKVQAFDAAGNFKYSYHDVQVDTTAPNVTGPSLNITNLSDNQTISGDASDNLNYRIRGTVEDSSDLVYYRVSIHPQDQANPGFDNAIGCQDASCSGGGAHYQTNTTSSVTSPQELFNWDTGNTGNYLQTGGHYKVLLEAKDAAGNTSQLIVSNITIENTSPPTIVGGSGGSAGGGSSQGNTTTTPSHFNQTNRAVSVSTQPATLVGGFGGGTTVTTTQATVGGGAATGTNNANQPAVLGAQTNQANNHKKIASNIHSSGNTADVLGDSTKQNSSCSTFLGICWYYWIPIVIAIAAIVAYLLNRRRNHLPETV